MSIFGINNPLDNPVNVFRGAVKAGQGIASWAGNEWNNLFGSHPAAPSAAPQQARPPAQVNAPSSDDAAWRNGLMAQIAALQAQTAAMPKLPTFDIMGNYNRAVATATAAVNPLYQKKLDNFLAQNAQKATDKRAASANETAGVNLDLANTQENNQVQRGRTAEDTATALQQIGQQEGQFQHDEGQQFDTARRTMAAGTAGAGLGASGLGAGMAVDALAQRNVQSGRQEDAFNNAKATKQLFQSRTFDDLTRSDTQAGALADNKNKGIQLDLDSYLSGLAGDEQNFRLQNEASRLGDIVNQTESYRQQGVNQFLASLAAGVASGKVRSQDYALAAQTYK